FAATGGLADGAGAATGALADGAGAATGALADGADAAAVVGAASFALTDTAVRCWLRSSTDFATATAPSASTTVAAMASCRCDPPRQRAGRAGASDSARARSVS